MRALSSHGAPRVRVWSSVDLISWGPRHAFQTRPGSLLLRPFLSLLPPTPACLQTPGQGPPQAGPLGNALPGHREPFPPHDPLSRGPAESPSSPSRGSCRLCGPLNETITVTAEPMSLWPGPLRPPTRQARFWVTHLLDQRQDAHPSKNKKEGSEF